MTKNLRILLLISAVAALPSMAHAQGEASAAAREAAAARDAAVMDAAARERAALAALGELPEEAETGCDRECLDEVAQAYLNSLVTHDISALTMAHNVRITEDGREIAPGEGYWRRAGGLRQHRLNIIDDYWGVAAGLAVMDDALLAYRITVEDGVIDEIETFVVDADEETLSRPTLVEPRIDFLRPVDPAEQNSRTELLRIAQYYPDGLKGGSFEAIDAPFPDEAERMENGMILAGPRCTFNENCTNMKMQPSPERPTLRQRNLAVDELQGIVFMWLDWEQQSGATLEVYEAFKIYGGQLHDVEAFIENDDRANYPGWPLVLNPREDAPG